VKFAPSVLPETPPKGLPCGIDWAGEDHAVSIVDVAGREIERFKIIHTDAGLSGLTGQLQARGVAEVAIERADGPVVDTLLAAGLTVVVISPNQLKNLRSRYGSGGQQRRPLQRLRAG
jgi:hypothetical protein